MPISSSSSSSSSSQPSCDLRDSISPNAAVTASVQLGNNSSAGGDAEFSLSGGGNTATGQKTWAGGSSGTLDSGCVDVDLSVDSGSASWSVEGGNPKPVTINPGNVESIDSIEVYAAANADCQLEWSDLVVTFRQGSTSYAVEIDAPCHPIAAGQTLVLRVEVPTQGWTGVTVHGSVRLHFPASPLPSASGVSGGITVYCS